MTILGLSAGLTDMVASGLHSFRPTVLSEASLKSFSQRNISEVMAMKARLLTSAITTGHVATDYLRLVLANQNPSTADTLPQAHAAHLVLESFKDLNTPPPDESAPPVKSLTMALTRDLRGIPGLSVGDCNEIGARLFRGCRVRLRGIPERTFVVKKIFWDFGEARIKEIGRDTEYAVPWDCLELCKE